MWWVVITISSSPAWGTLVWVLWQGQIRPRLLPLSQIEAKAAEMITQYGNNALEMAAIEEDRAWRYSDSFKQGDWKRIIQELIEVKNEANKLSNSRFTDMHLSPAVAIRELPILR